MATQDPGLRTQDSHRARLRALGLRPRRRLSQSFLEDQRVAAAIVRAAHLDAHSEVLEVGPGLGVLTKRLAHAAERVVAVEIDPHLADELNGIDNVTVVNADILAIRPEDYFERPYTVVANLPYHITSPALRHLLAAGPPFAERLVVMVQAEVAEGITATPGDMSALSVITQVQAHVRIVRRVPSSAFFPKPKVESAVMVLETVNEGDRLVQRGEVPAFSDLVHAGFKQPRKKLANSLADGLDVAKGEVIMRLASAGIDGQKRPGVLRVEDWAKLFRTP